MPRCMHGRPHKINIFRNRSMQKVERYHTSTKIDEQPLSVAFRKNVIWIFSFQAFGNLFEDLTVGCFTCRKTDEILWNIASAIPVVLSFAIAFFVIPNIVSWSKTYDLFFSHVCSNPTTSTIINTNRAPRTIDLIFLRYRYTGTMNLLARSSTTSNYYKAVLYN